MEDYNKIIESLGIRYVKSQNIHVPAALQVSQYRESDTALLVLKRGKIMHGSHQLLEGQALFIPSGKSIDLTFGEPSLAGVQMDMEEFTFRRGEFFTETSRESVAEF